MQPDLSLKSIAIGIMTILCAVTLLASCVNPSPKPESGTPTATPSATFNSTPAAQIFRPRISHAPPEGNPAPRDVEIMLLAGLDSDFPYPGRTDALMLAFYSRSQGNAAVVSIPPDMLVTLPQGDQVRLNTVYALQGIAGLGAVLKSNLGVVFDHYLIVNKDVMESFANQFNGVLIQMDDPISRKCNNLPPGTWVVKGSQFTCLLSLRVGPDEISRNKRQASLIRSLFNTLVYNGTLTRLNSLYQEFQDQVYTDLDLFDLITLVPLALRIADQGHLEFYSLQKSDLQVQVINSTTGAVVLAPASGSLEALFANALNVINTPVPQTELLTTLQYRPYPIAHTHRTHPPCDRAIMVPPIFLTT